MNEERKFMWREAQYWHKRIVKVEKSELGRSREKRKRLRMEILNRESTRTKPTQACSYVCVASY